jgi:hypothetical protein
VFYPAATAAEDVLDKGGDCPKVFKELGLPDAAFAALGTLLFPYKCLSIRCKGMILWETSERAWSLISPMPGLFPVGDLGGVDPRVDGITVAAYDDYKRLLIMKLAGSLDIVGPGKDKARSTRKLPDLRADYSLTPRFGDRVRGAFLRR